MCNIPYYVTGSDVSQARQAPYPFCYNPDVSQWTALYAQGFFCVMVIFALCTMPVVSQGLICHKAQYVIRYMVRVGIPL